MERVRRAVANIRQQLGRLGPTHRLLIGCVAVLIVMGLFLVSQYAGSPRMVPLLAGAPADEQAQAAAHLRSAGMQVSTNAEGQLAVPAERVHLALAQLAQARKLPSNTSILFDNLIEKQKWTMPSSQLEQIYNTARENELALIIANFPGIDSAKVFISIPEPRGLGSAYKKATAQVTVFTRGGGSLDQDTVDALADVVSGSTAGLDTSAVRVIDGTRQKRYRPRSPDDLAAGSYMEHVVKAEQRLQDKLLEHLRYVDNVIVSVNAMVDASVRDERTMRYLDKGDGTVALVSSETFSNQTERGGTEGAAPGVRSNTGMAIGEGGGSSEVSTNETGETKMESRFGSTETRTVSPAGMPRRLFATISLPREHIVALIRAAQGESAEPTADEIEAEFEKERARIEQDVAPLLRTAAEEVGSGAEGAAPSEAMVRVSLIPVAMSGEVRAQPAGVGSMVFGLSSPGAVGGTIKRVALGALAVVALGMMFVLARRSSKPPVVPSAHELIGIPPSLATDEDLIGEAEEGEPAMIGIEVDDGELKSRRMLTEIGELVNKKPTEASSILRQWLAGES